RIVVAAGNLISCAAFAAYLFVHGQLAVTAAAVAAGAGQATLWTGTRALIAEVARPGERRSWFSLQTAIRSAGYGLGAQPGAAAGGGGARLGRSAATAWTGSGAWPLWMRSPTGPRRCCWSPGGSHRPPPSRPSPQLPAAAAGRTGGCSPTGRWPESPPSTRRS